MVPNAGLARLGLTRAEAMHYLSVVAAGQSPAEANYSLLLAEQAALAAIKQARRTGKLAVGAVSTLAEVDAAEAVVIWPQDAKTGCDKAP